MGFRKFWKESFPGFVLKNILIAIAGLVALVWITLIGIDFYTNHGEVEIVPDLRGTYIEEAQNILAKKGLTVQVIDSVYVRDKKLGTIIDQNPAPNSTVKSNRPIYITINSRLVRQVTLPDVSDVSYRQADAMLQAIGLSVSSVEYAPSDYKDLVSEVKYRGRSILPGTRIPEGSSVVLVVGSGEGFPDAEIPNLKGMTLTEATDEVTLKQFAIGAVEYDVQPDGNEDDYVVYRQRPSATTIIQVGTKIDVYLSKNKQRMKEVFEEDNKKEETNEQFF